MSASPTGPQDEAVGAWIFVSHSNKDLAQVRIVRDALEARGHHPLLFFLKCLGDDVEIDDLVRREIEARTWFVLCDSENARTSRWVQSEVDFIKSLVGKVYEVVDLDGGLDGQLERIDRLSRRATVFLSYSPPDEAVADQLRDALRQRDYAVWDPKTGLEPGSDWQQGIRAAVENAMANGLFVILLSPEALESQSIVMELNYALDIEAARNPGRRWRIVPVLIRGASVQDLPETIQDRQPLVLESDHFEAGVEELVRVLKLIDA